MQIGQKTKEFEQIEQTKKILEEEGSDAYSLFVYAIRSQVTKDYYLRRLRIFFNHINLLPGGSLEERCNLFAIKGNREIHDRWIISNNLCFNIPSPDVIARGQFSEIKSTENIPPFEYWWHDGYDIISQWNEIEKIRTTIP